MASATTPALKPPSGKPAPAAASGIRWTELSVPVAVLSIIVAMITPMPALLLDVLISANITASVIILLVSLYIIKPVEFSVFPTTLLLMTLFRLALNVSSARLILLNGNSGTAAAGHVIEAFGNFVVGGNYIIGIVIFLVLIAIQYVVINHGAVRISEVTARFTLDAMPGKQMSIDSDLNAGLIDEPEARQRRKMLTAEAEFYGAMDGASRFTQRDAVASILITAINIIAGFLIGVLQHGMDLKRAIQTYTILTIGDGLVTVIPALMISISGAFIVTRASSETQISTEVHKQVFSNSQPILLASGVLGALALFPGLPTVPFLVLASATGYGGWRLRQKESAVQAPDAPPAPTNKESVENLLKVEPIAVEVGLGLVKLVDGAQNSVLIRKIGAIRKQIATELGYILPPVRVTDNLALRAREYIVSLKGVEIARYELPQGCDLAIPIGKAPSQIEGTPTKEPAFGIPAIWVPTDRIDKARSSGYTVVDTLSVLGTHLGELIRSHSHELFSRQDAKKFLDRVGEENPKIVEDLVPKLLPLAIVQKVLQNLLRERVSIRDASSILEALSEAANVTKNPVLLTEFVRQSIRRMLVQPYLNKSGDLTAFFVDSSIENAIESAVEHTEHISHLNLPPQKIRELMERITRGAGHIDAPTAALTSSGSRYFLRQIAESNVPNLFFLGHNEVPAGVRVVSLGNIN